jgi:hypothetical protein
MPKAPAKPKGLPRRVKPPVVPMRKDQYTAPLQSAQHERLLGRAIMAWTKLDACLQALLWAFIDVGMSDGRIITSRLDSGMVIKMLRALAKRNVVPEKLETFLSAFNLADDLREDRNFLAHSTGPDHPP